MEIYCVENAVLQNVVIYNESSVLVKVRNGGKLLIENKI